jgi:mannose-6-phosphate isomerase-like protein (cupin superfamily)
MELHMQDRVVDLAEGEFFIVKRGVEHKPVAQVVCHALLFEPASTGNTLNVNHEYTIEPRELQHI